MDLFAQLLGVAAVLCSLAGALWWLRRKGWAQFAAPGRRSKADRHLTMVERLSLAPQHSLHLVRLADRAILVAVSPSGTRVLESFAWSALTVEARTEVVRRKAAEAMA